MTQSLNALTLADREFRQVKAELGSAARAFAELARLLVEDDPSAIVARCEWGASYDGPALRSSGESDPPHWPDRKEVLALVARHLAASKAFENARCRAPDGFHLLDVRNAA